MFIYRYYFHTDFGCIYTAFYLCLNYNFLWHHTFLNEIVYLSCELLLSISIIKIFLIFYSKSYTFIYVIQNKKIILKKKKKNVESRNLQK